jgi:hypothetical protein
MQVETGIVMPGGWHFIQNNAKISGLDYFDLLTNVQQWRLENHLPVGDVKLEVDAFICNTYPLQCHDTTEVPASITFVPQNNSKLEALTQWYVTTRAKNPIIVFQTQAEQRAEICVGCPFNREWKNSCPACVSNVERMGAFMRQGRDVSQFRKLGQCSVLSQDNRTAVWLGDNALDKSSDVIPNCWLKQ